MDQVDLVKRYLRGQNLEQLGRRDDAVAEYEAAVADHFDSPGPYDRLIDLYGRQALHKEVMRIATAALGSVHTYESKRKWYSKIHDEAAKAAAAVPTAVPRAVPKRT